MRHRVTGLLSSIAAILLMAGCANGTSAAGTSDPAPSEAMSPPTPAFAENTARQSGEASKRPHLVLVDVRAAQREGFDRVVLEFSGSGTPGWVVNYVDEAVLDGSGEVVALEGDAVLDIYASGTTWPAPDYYDGPRQLTQALDGGVVDVYVGGTFEGVTQVLAGIDGDRVPFRVFALTAPSRLVIDVMTRSNDNG